MSLTLPDNLVLPSRSRAQACLLDLQTQWRNSSLQLVERINHPDRCLARDYVARVERPRPQDYAAYHDLLVGMSLKRDASEAAATSLLARASLLTSDRAVSSLPRLTNFSRGFYSDEALGIMSRWLGIEDAGHVRLGGIPGPRYMAQSALVRRALRCLACYAPEVHDEITQVVSEIVLLTFEPSGDKRSTWRSACSFAVWGAVFLDPAHNTDELDYLLSIVEEAARLALFAASLRQPLVMVPTVAVDEPDRRQQDTRLEAVDARVHAAYAATRSAYVLQRLQDASGTCTNAFPRTAPSRRGWIAMPWSAERLELAHSKAVARYWAHHVALRRSRWLSVTGRELMYQTCVFMADAYGWPTAAS